MDDQQDRSSFIGYHLRVLEERIEVAEKSEILHFEEVKTRLIRIEKKIDALTSGMTPAEIAEAVKTINADVARLDKVAESSAAIVDKLAHTGV